MFLKIGELARRTGLTVRTLHHYDAIKLLCSSTRSDAGYRLYNRQDIERLHRIQALRRLGLSLAEIAELLLDGGADLQTVIEQQIVSLDRQVARTIELRERLKSLLARVSENLEPDLPNWLTTLEMMAIHDRYFTSDELAALRLHREQLKEDIASEAAGMIAAIRALMARGVPPEAGEAQQLSRQWMAWTQKSMCGDPRLILKLDTMHRNEPTMQAQTGVDGAVIDYMSRAAAEYRLSIYAKYLSAEELAPIREKYHGKSVQWLTLIAQVRDQMEQGSGPCSPSAQVLCSRWLEGSREVWGNDPQTHMRAHAALEREPELFTGTGASTEMVAFLRQGIAHLLAAAKTNKTGATHAG
ncbi:MAG TPA: MerR family transcriptional regulator [Burkholderiaceae bacterium]|nr:MerR family transcriptional regulator [Burkholderiaceae bacterium]